MRYYRLLPPNGLYTQQQIRVLSSAAERCIMSANSLLAGFMPPLEHSNPLPMQWQPVPVNTIPRQEDTVNTRKLLIIFPSGGFYIPNFTLSSYSYWPRRNHVPNMIQF